MFLGKSFFCTNGNFFFVVASHVHRKRGYPMSLETLMWSLPIVFMLHDFEEIIMFQPWLQRESARLRERFPRFAPRMLGQFERLSTSSFALAVAEEFVLLSAVTYWCVASQRYTTWTAILLFFFLHLLMHIGQFAVYQRYIPTIVTSVAASMYCVVALWFVVDSALLDWSALLIETLIVIPLVVLNFVFAHWLAAQFEVWLRHYARVS